MKTLFVSLVSFSMALFFACQENFVTDQPADQPVDKLQTAPPTNFLSGTIPLENLLRDPHNIGNSFYRVSGQIQYEQKNINEDKESASSQRYILLSFSTSAEFYYVCTLCPPQYEDELAGFISDVSEDLVQVGGNYVSLLEKTFPIQGREDGMVLKCRFTVSTTSVELNAMWLALPVQNQAAINNY